MTASPEREITREMVGAMHRSTGAYELVVAALAAAAVGWAVDAVVGTTPIFLLVFALAGFIGASYSIWLTYRTQMQVAETERTARRNERRK